MIHVQISINDYIKSFHLLSSKRFNELQVELCKKRKRLKIFKPKLKAKLFTYIVHLSFNI